MRSGSWGAIVVAVVVVLLTAGVVLVLALPDGGSGPASEVTTTTVAVAQGPVVLGLSAEGRPIEAYEFGGGARRVLVVGGIHGDETGGPVARELLRYLETHPEALPAEVRLTLIPSANPDGEVAGTRGNANGVDLNRNFPSADWSEGLSQGDRPAGGLTGGRAPGSEPETQALLACLAGGYDLVIALHSQGGIIDYDGDAGRSIAERMSALSGLPVQHLDYQEYVTGSLGTYVPEAYGVPVITVELEGTALPESLREALLAGMVE